MATRWTAMRRGTQGGVQGKMGAQSPPVDQGQGPGNSLAHHVGAEVHEVTVYLQLR